MRCDERYSPGLGMRIFVPNDDQPQGGVTEGWWVILRGSMQQIRLPGASYRYSDDRTWRRADSERRVSIVDIIVACLSRVSQKHRAQEDMKVLTAAVRSFGTWYMAWQVRDRSRRRESVGLIM